jgi:hypothetical protein
MAATCCCAVLLLGYMDLTAGVRQGDWANDGSDSGHGTVLAVSPYNPKIAWHSRRRCCCPGCCATAREAVGHTEAPPGCLGFWRSPHGRSPSSPCPSVRLSKLEFGAPPCSAACAALHTVAQPRPRKSEWMLGREEINSTQVPLLFCFCLPLSVLLFCSQLFLFFSCCSFLSLFPSGRPLSTRALLMLA